MTLALLMEVLHVLSVFWFVGGLLGRAVAQAQARRSRDIREVDAFLAIASHFERAIVRPGSLVLLAGGLVTAFLKGWPVLGGLQGGEVDWLFASLLIFATPFMLVPLVFIPRGRVFRVALEDARAQGRVTPELTAALGDRTVALGHAWEWIAVVAITALMVAKPF
jgi:uncharacterized membrane protein